MISRSYSPINLARSRGRSENKFSYLPQHLYGFPEYIAWCVFMFAIDLVQHGTIGDKDNNISSFIRDHLKAMWGFYSWLKSLFFTRPRPEPAILQELRVCSGKRRRPYSSARQRRKRRRLRRVAARVPASSTSLLSAPCMIARHFSVSPATSQGNSFEPH